MNMRLSVLFSVTSRREDRSKGASHFPAHILDDITLYNPIILVKSSLLDRVEFPLDIGVKMT
jgi:hypothetical protein